MDAHIKRVDSETEKPADGYGASTSKMQATSAELKALDLALKSSVPELHQIGEEANATGPRSWRQAHHL